MIPIQLTIQGLYSYQKKQTIDFTQLTAANLFGIFGSVGSGKSSILEAITFALYGKTDRLNLSGDNRNYNMMNLKSNELLIEFEFETGKTQTAYRATVKGKRNSKRFDDVKALERTTYQKIDDKWIPIETSALEQAIGLSYENFKRTIIIPQGQFQEFLQLGNKDRTQMLKELFNLEKFELFYKVVALESRNNEQKQNIQGQLQQLGEINSEQIQIFQEQLTQIEKELIEWNEKLQNQQKQENQWQKIKELVLKFDAAKIELENLQKEQPYFIQLEKTIHHYEKCVIQFKNILDALATSNKKLILKTEQIKIDKQKLELEEVEIKTKEAFLAEIKPAYETRELLKQRAEELHKIIKIKELAKSIQTENERLENGNKILVETGEKVKTLKVGIDNLAIEIKAEKLKLPDFTLLSKIKTWHVEKINIDKQNTEISNEIGKLQGEEKTIKEAIQEVYSDPIFNKLQERNDVLQSIQFVQQKIESTKTSLKLLEKEADHLRVKAQLEKYAKNLEDEKPCPLCGSTHHPEIYSAENILEEQNKIEKAKLVFEDEIKKLDNTISHLKELDSKLNFNSKIFANWQTKSAENKTKTEEHNFHFQWPGFTNPKTVEDTFNTAVNLQNLIKKKEDELEKVTEQFETEIKKKDQYQVGIDKIRTALTIHQTETKTIQQQLKIVSVDQFSTKSANEIEDEKQLLLKQYSALEKQFNDLTAQITKLQETKNNLIGSLTANKLELTLEQKANADLQFQLENELSKTEYSNIDEVKQILSQSIDLEKQKQLLSNFNQNIALAKSRFEEVQKEMGNLIYDAVAHEKIKEEIKISNAEITSKKEKSGEIKTLLKKLLDDIKAQAALRESFEKLELRAENIKTLKSLFKASGFVNYISSVYLQNLCNAANDRFFKLTRQKLSLEITEDNNFQVRDFMNGGKVRNVKTLSGGQTFQAALSLALALADNIQKITESNQNFFFLDEGFGSLDKESLSVVFDTLKSLRSENRIVGVISHVEEMQQEIDVHLRIENNDETGSLIYESWAG